MPHYPLRIGKALGCDVDNLISNAVKYYSPDRSPRVDGRAHVRAGHTVLEVQDNGLGIAAAYLPKRFTMFQRFHDHVEGTGIGLYMVKRMVEDASGHLDVYSQLGAGTTFFVHLPHAPLTLCVFALFPSYAIMAAISRTLLVDDDDTTNFLNQALLQRMAIADTILVAGNGQEALALLRTHCEPAASPTCPALILLDRKMPLMNGFEFLQAYAKRSFTDNPAVVISMLTTALNPRDVEQIRGLPINGYLTKPLTTAKITYLLQEHFGYSATAG